MAYERTVWENGITPINAANLNNIEDGINEVRIDYIVETGTSGIWTYEKWASGKCVCEGNGQATSTFTTACAITSGNNGIYEGQKISVDLPTGLFKSVNYTPLCSARTGNGAFDANATVNGNNFSFYPMNLFKQTSAITVNYFARVTGEWK